MKSIIVFDKPSDIPNNYTCDTYVATTYNQQLADNGVFAIIVCSGMERPSSGGMYAEYEEVKYVLQSEFQYYSGALSVVDTALDESPIIHSNLVFVSDNHYKLLVAARDIMNGGM